MRGIFGVLLVSVALVAGMAFVMLYRGDAPTDDTSENALEFYCAMGINKPVSDILQQYRERYGVEVVESFDGSGSLIGKMKASGKADLYLAADESYADVAREQGLEVIEALPIAYQHPVIAVHAGNPLGITSLEDIVNSEQVRLYLASPDAAAISKVARKSMGTAQWERLWKLKVTERPTVSNVANDVAVEPNGVGIIWDITAAQYDKIDAVEVDAFKANRNQITLFVMGTSTRPTSSLKLARYMTARDEGLPIFHKWNYETVTGDAWAGGSPEIKVYSGGLNQQAVLDTIKQFERREGVRVTTKYGGCGELVGLMRSATAERPDVYFSCDKTYMDVVEDFFYEPIDVSGTDMVIVVPKGNEHGISKLEDLAKTGINVGVCDAERSALGVLTENLLKKHGLLKRVQVNIKDNPTTAPLLVAKVASDGLDAAIVYLANAKPMSAKIEIIAIDDPDARAMQNIAVGRLSEHYHLSKRLVDAIMSAKSGEKFKSLGFRWHGNDAKR